MENSGIELLAKSARHATKEKALKVREDSLVLFVVLLVPTVINVLVASRYVWLPLQLFPVYFLLRFPTIYREYVWLAGIVAFSIWGSLFIGQSYEQYTVIIAGFFFGLYLSKTEIETKNLLILVLAIGLLQILSIEILGRGRTHWVPWTYLVLLFLYFDKRRTRNIYLDSSLFLFGLFVAVVSDSRSSILMYFVLTLFCITIGNSEGRHRTKWLMFGVTLLGGIFGVANTEMIINSIAALRVLEGSSLSARLMEFGPRELIYECYASSFNSIWLIAGVNIENLWDTCGLYFSHIEFGRSESSVMNIIGLLGITGVLMIIKLVPKLVKITVDNQLVGVTLLMILIRSATGDFLIATPHDWLVFYVLFSKKNEQV